MAADSTAAVDAPLFLARARELVLDAVVPLAAEQVELGLDALGRVLASDVIAAADVPAFDNSAMDGFAVVAAQAEVGVALPIAGESRAGAPAQAPLPPGAAIAISTGAALPVGADAVAPVEISQLADGAVALTEAVRPGQNVRPAGSDMRGGTTVLHAGTRLAAGELALAVAAGAGSLHCARRPRVAVVATGDELVAPGAPLHRGQLHDSNSIALAALARQSGAEIVGRGGAADSLEAVIAALEPALGDADVLVIAGGVSVGEHDHVKPALERLGVEQRFWRVALRPGKPTWFGAWTAVPEARTDATAALATAPRRTLVFALPGNPVSAIVTFLLFVRPALAALQGAPADAPTRSARLSESIPRGLGRVEAVRVVLEEHDGELLARPTGPQGSHQLTSLLGAGGLTLVEPGDGELEAGSTVTVELI